MPGTVPPDALAAVLEALRGTDGKPGRDGVDGAAGTQGPKGDTGGRSTEVDLSTRLPDKLTATDDERIDDFLAEFGTSNRKPRLIFDERGEVDIRGQHMVPRGGFTVGDPNAIATQGDSHNSNATLVRLRNKTGAAVFRLPDNTAADGEGPWNVKFHGVAFDAVPGEGNRLIEPNPKATPWKLFVVNSSYANGPGLIGSTAQAQPVDAFGVLGQFCDFNNITDTAWNIGGSDCAITADYWLLNSPLSLKKDGPLAIFSALSKTPVQNGYTTVQGAQIGFLVKQGGKGGVTFGPGLRLEGRLSANACLGSLAHLYADTAWVDANLNYAMRDPKNGWGGAAKNGGFVHAFGGNHIASVIHARYPTGVSLDTPLWYQETGALRINTIIGERDGDNAVFRPVVKVGPKVDVVADGSVRVLPI